jgi:hypothetical protein
MWVHSRRLLPVSPAFLFTLALLTLPAESLRAQTTGPLFVSAARPAAPALAFDASVLRSREVEVQVSQLASADARSAGATLDLNLFADATFTAVFDRVDTSASGFVWVGHIADVPMSSVTLAVEGTTVYGSVLMPGGSYLVKPGGDGISTIVEIDQSAFPPEAEPLVPSTSASVNVERDAPSLDPKMEGDDGLLIDVLVLYTPAAATAAGGAAAMNTLIANAISITNTSYSNSGVYQRVRLVAALSINYTESGDIGTDLSNITAGTGAFSGVAALRNTYRADLVSLMTNTPGSPFCGVAWLMTSLSVGFAPNGYSVVEQACAVGNLSFPHELGHNMGLRHDWYVDDGVTPASYAHGYVNSAAKTRTIMAYNNRCAAQGFNCTRLPVWSNPGIGAMGVQAGTSTACVDGSLAGNCDADDHRMLNESAYFVANFRVLSAGAVSAGFGGTLGLWNYVSAGGWQPLHPFTPSLVLRRDIDGNGRTDVVAVFPGYGVWAYMNSTSWVNLHPQDASEIKAGDVNGNGRVDLVFNFPGQGVWLRYDSGAWSNLHPLNANRMAVGDLDDVTGRAEVILSFSAYGVWAHMNGTSWVHLTTAVAQDLEVGDLDGNGKGDLVGYFSGAGVWVYRNNTSWAPLYSGVASGIVLGNIDGDAGRRSDVVLNLPPYGVWVWRNDASWMQLHPLQSPVMSIGDLDNNGVDELFLGFAGHGLYVWNNNSSWVPLSSNLPATMAGSR